MRLTKVVRQAIAEMPDNGEWWKSSSEETFVAVAKMLKEKGLSDDEVMDVLTSLYSATSSEYGN